MQQSRRVTLYKHPERSHTPRNINLLHAAEQAAAGFNTRLAVGLTQRVGTMWAAYSFVVLALMGLAAIFNLLPPIVILLAAWTSQELIQLVMLPIIMVGQNVLGRKQELQSDEMFHTTQQSFADIESMKAHLNAQDEELLLHKKLVLDIVRKLDTLFQTLTEVQEENHLLRQGFSTFANQVYHEVQDMRHDHVE